MKSLLSVLFLFDILCGTGDPATQRAFPKRADRQTGLSVAHTTRFANDFLFVRADEETVPFDDPNDLEGTSLHFRRRDAETFEVTRGSLAYDDDAGPLLESFGRGTTTRELALPFAFPFGGQSHERLVLSVTRGIHFADRPSIPAHAFTAAEMLLGEQPLLAPHFDYQGSPGSRPDLYAKQSPASLTLTWRSQGPATAPFDVQAVLFPNGDFAFHYKTIAKLAWGGVIVRTGADTWRSQRTELASANDVTGDADATWGTSAAMLDITRVDVARVAGSSLLEVRIRVATPIDRNVLSPGVAYRLYLGDSFNRIELFVYPDRLVYRLGSMPDLPPDVGFARVDGDEVTLYVPEELLLLDARVNRLLVQTGTTLNADELSITLDLGPPAASAETDFSAIDTLVAAKPLVETFRLGRVDVTAVWDRLKREFDYSDADIDAVAVYTSFYSDLITSAYGAFATFSNPGADGVSPSSDADAPKTATLLNMNALDFGLNTSESGRLQLLLHELGHRWLYYFSIREDRNDTRSLNPRGPHPAGYVHTAAAFDGDSSAMGGANFTASADGSFHTGTVAKFGYSWHELYLMGLAAQSEVPPWFLPHRHVAARRILSALQPDRDRHATRRRPAPARRRDGPPPSGVSRRAAHIPGAVRDPRAPVHSGHRRDRAPARVRGRLPQRDGWEGGGGDGGLARAAVRRVRAQRIDIHRSVDEHAAVVALELRRWSDVDRAQSAAHVRGTRNVHG